MKDVLCDSSSIISLADSCLDGVLHYLHSSFGVRFIIPPEVEYEVITRPLSNGLKQYYFSALKTQKLLNDGVLVKSTPANSSMRQEVLEAANKLFFMKGKAIRLVHEGEAGMIGLARELGLSAILIDERTTRMLIETPIRLKKHLEQEFGVNVMVNKANLKKFAELTANMQVIRSSELMILAHENGFMGAFPNDKKLLEAALYKIKFSGCSITFDEISKFVRE